MQYIIPLLHFTWRSDSRSSLEAQRLVRIPIPKLRHDRGFQQTRDILGTSVHDYIISDDNIFHCVTDFDISRQLGTANGYVRKHNSSGSRSWTRLIPGCTRSVACDQFLKTSTLNWFIGSCAKYMSNPDTVICTNSSLFPTYSVLYFSHIFTFSHSWKTHLQFNLAKIQPVHIRYWLILPVQHPLLSSCQSYSRYSSYLDI